jgi:hypothetical protein
MSSSSFKLNQHLILRFLKCENAREPVVVAVKMTGN